MHQMLCTWGWRQCMLGPVTPGLPRSPRLTLLLSFPPWDLRSWRMFPLPFSTSRFRCLRLIDWLDLLFDWLSCMIMGMARDLFTIRESILKVLTVGNGLGAKGRVENHSLCSLAVPVPPCSTLFHLVGCPYISGSRGTTCVCPWTVLTRRTLSLSLWPLSSNNVWGRRT